MRPTRLLAALSLLAAATLDAQRAPARTTAERLGYPAGTKLLIIHADDIGVAHSVNQATFDAFQSGAITSASIMMPTPWVTEVAAWAKQHPDADFGLHLTLTSEWKAYRWGPLTAGKTLTDSVGRQWPLETDVAARVSPDDAEREIRAQIRLARDMGIRPTHLDSHMGSLFTTPALYARLAKVAREEGIPFLATSDGTGRGTNQPAMRAGEITLDHVVTIGDEIPPEQWKQWYFDAVKTLKPGLTEMIVHVGRDDAELQAVTVDHPSWGSAWRQRDFDLLSSAEFRQLLADNGVKLVTWRQLARAVQP